MEHKIIKDFIYLDNDVMYSLYSQLFEGVADQIIQSEVAGINSTDKQSSSFFSGNSIDTQVAEISKKTENKILHDHMFNKLEDKISTLIFDVNQDNNVTIENIEKSFILKGGGRAEINDYERVKSFIDNFNSLGEGIAYSSTVSDENFNLSLTQMNKELSSIKDRNQKSKAKQHINSLKDPKKLAKQLGLHQDEKLLAFLSQFIDQFYKNLLEIIVLPFEDDTIVLKGIIEKKWLRKPLEHFHILFGDFISTKWTIVGQVTNSVFRDERTPIKSIENSEKISIKDIFQDMHIAMKEVDDFAYSSIGRTEVTIKPLAIYREIKVPKNLDMENAEKK